MRNARRFLINRRSIFLLLSGLIFLADALFVAINYRGDRQTLDATLHEEGAALQKSYGVALSMTLASMQQLATFVAGDPRVQSTFEQAVAAVQREGGGAGGVAAAQLRDALYRIVAPGWQKMTQTYGVRQLHFHMGPGSTSFLRVHKPEKFGDNMDDLRHMVVDVYRDQQPRTGLELGRVYAGLRGIVPVYSAAVEDELIGVLEVGTSYGMLIESLSEAIGAEVAVLLREDRVENATWQRPEESLMTDCGCFIEATSSAQLASILRALGPDAAAASYDGRTDLVEADGGYYAATSFAIQDYIGLRDNHTEPVGRVVIWRPVDERVAALEAGTWRNVVYALIGFLVVEIVLFIGMRLTLRQLEFEVGRRTDEIRSLNEQLKEMAERDFLTGLYTRRFFMQRFEQECNRANREGTPLSLMMFDLDHFKRINDTYGHPAGDRVLSDLGTLLLNSCRNYDLVARLGGEEFCILMPGLGAEEAYKVAETLRLKISRTIRIPQAEQRVSTSIGVAACSRDHDCESLLTRADQALYAAKAAGRDRTVLFQPGTATAVSADSD